jgi:hypothetical protein
MQFAAAEETPAFQVPSMLALGKGEERLHHHLCFDHVWHLSLLKSRSASAAVATISLLSMLSLQAIAALASKDFHATMLDPELSAVANSTATNFRKWKTSGCFPCPEWPLCWNLGFFFRSGGCHGKVLWIF